MNIICETCDTRNRLGMCSGKDGDFKYCMRKCGSISGLEESIVQFNTIEDLKNNPNKYIKNLDLNSLWIAEKDWLEDEHMHVMIGKYIGGETEHPVGYVIN